MQILKAASTASVVLLAVSVGVGLRIPRSIYVLDWGLTFGLSAALRFTIRGYREWLTGRSAPGERRAIVIGAGDAAEELLRSVWSTSGSYTIVGLVDDDRRKRHAVMRGFQVLGTVSDLPALAAEFNASEALLAIPSAPLEERHRVTRLCRDAGLVVRSVPPLRDLIDGRASVGQLEPVAPEDLLRRERVEVDLDRLREQIKDKRILVTGAAGSIEIGRAHV